MAIATINPATGEVLKTFEPLTDAQIEEKVRLAEETFPKFRALSFAERGKMMMKAADMTKR
jgi:succinate-semialdehyde dehydrogenase/glutarate-semialdehyde dehydrogenase